MATSYYASRLPQSGRGLQPGTGFLICPSSRLARTGWQNYTPAELELDHLNFNLIPVYRDPSQVFAKTAMASFEGAALTDEHPASGGINAGNVQAFIRGHIQFVRPSADRQFLLGDVLIQDPVLIDKVQNGVKTDISLGYNYALYCRTCGEPASNGCCCEFSDDNPPKFEQRGIIGNHAAIVASGRAQNTQVCDAAPRGVRQMTSDQRLDRRLDRFLDLSAKLVNHVIKDETAAVRRQARDRAAAIAEMKRRRSPEAQAAAYELAVRDAGERLRKAFAR